MSQIRIHDQRGQGIPYICLRIAEGDKPQEQAVYDVLVKDDGSTGWPIPGWSSSKRYTVYVNVGDYAQPQYTTAKIVTPDDLDANGDADITLSDTGVGAPGPTPTDTPRLKRDGVNLVTEAGAIRRLSGASFFAGYWLFLERGPDALRPALAQLRDRWRVNCLVVFGMSVNVQANLFQAPPFDPSNYGFAYLTQWQAFLALCAEYGMYVYWVAFPDHGLIPAYAMTASCQTLWNGLLDKARAAPNLLLKPTNEGSVKDYNYINPHSLIFPEFCPVAAVDYGVHDDAWASGTLPVGADWGGDRSCGDLHPPREGAATVMDCACLTNVYYKQNRAVFISEPIRMGSNGSAGVTREVARLVGLASQVGPALRVFHSLQGEKCEVYDAETQDHADAYFTGV